MRRSEQGSIEPDATDAALRRANRALRLFSRISSAVVHATEKQALFDEICRIAVDVAGYPMAWIGRAEHDERRTVRPVAFAGPGRASSSVST